MSDSHAKIVRAEPVAMQPAQRMHPLVGAAIEGGVIDPATLEKLLALQERWEAGEARKAYTHAMAALKADLPRVLPRDMEVKFKDVRYTHTSLALAVEKVVPVLTCHGFSHSWIPRTADRKVEVTCRLTHTEGHFEECTLDSEPDKSGMKSSSQAIASTITLLQRYSLLSLLGIATADMQEPQPDPSEVVDVRQNTRAAATIAKEMKITREAIEKRVGKPIAAWTGADLDDLREWLRAWREGEDTSGEVA